MRGKPSVRLEGQLGGGTRLYVYNVFYDLHDYEVVELAESVLRQLAAMEPRQLQAAEAAAASLRRSEPGERSDRS